MKIRSTYFRHLLISLSQQNATKFPYLFIASMMFLMVSEYSVVKAKGPLVFFEPKHDRTASLSANTLSKLSRSQASPLTTSRFSCLNKRHGDVNRRTT